MPRKSFDYSQIKDIVESRGFTLLSDSYVNAKTKLQVKCKCGNVFNAILSNLKRQKGCLVCVPKKLRKTLGEVKGDVEKKGYKLISNTYVNGKTKLEVECPKHGTFKIRYNDLQQGHGCEKCAKQKIGKIFSLKYEDVKFWVEENTEYKLISDTYKNNLTHLRLECSEHGVFKMPFKRLKIGVRCQKCASLINKSENECREIFERITGKKFPTVRPEFLTNPETGYKLELDGYNKELKIAFEYDGEQHFNPIEHFGGQDKFEALQKNDQLKDELCQEHDITLIRIPHWISDRETYITNKLGSI